jgi:hypothetical protein
MSSSKFDVFLSYSGGDRLIARELNRKLRDKGIRVWFDEDQIPFGGNVIAMMEHGLAQSAAGAVLIGSDGRGAWQEQEKAALLIQAVDEGKVVIPILMPGAPTKPKPGFLASLRFVDLRDGLDGEGFSHLVQGMQIP